jgi:hypothetical protein
MRPEFGLAQIVRWLPVVAILFAPVFLRYDASGGFSNQLFYDFGSMAPLAIYYVTGVAIVCVFSLVLVGSRRAGMIIFVSLWLLMGALEVIVNYPNVVYLDVFLHGGNTRFLLDTGYLPTGRYEWTTLSILPYAAAYPLAFLLWDVLSIVSAIGLIPCNVLVLNTVVNLLLAIVIYKFFEKKTGYAVYASLLVMYVVNFEWQRYTWDHYSPVQLGIVAALLALWAWQRVDLHSGRTSVLVALLFTGIAIGSHPFVGLVMSAYLVARQIFSRKEQRFAVIGVAAAVLFVAWSIFFATGYVSEFFYFLTYPEFWMSKYQNIGIGLIGIQENIPAFGVALRTYYRLLLGVLGVLSAIALLRIWRGKKDMMFVAWTGAVVLSGLVYIMGTNDRIGGLERSIFLGSVSFGYLAPAGAVSLWVLARRHWPKWNVRLLAKTLPLLVLLAVPHYALAHEISFYGNAYRHTWNQAVVLFADQHVVNSSLSADEWTIITYSFYEPLVRNQNLILYEHYNSSAPREIVGAYSESMFKIISELSMVRYLQGNSYNLTESSTRWEAIRISLISGNSVIYSNGYGVVLSYE